MFHCTCSPATRQLRLPAIHIVQTLNRVDFHHNDLRPECIVRDLSGRIKIVDLHEAGPCDCEEECVEVDELLEELALGGRSLSVPQ